MFCFIILALLSWAARFKTEILHPVYWPIFEQVRFKPGWCSKEEPASDAYTQKIDGTYVITVDHDVISEGIICFIFSTLLNEMGHVLHSEYDGWDETDNVQHGKRWRELVKKLSNVPDDKITSIAAEEYGRKHQCYGEKDYHCWVCD